MKKIMSVFAVLFLALNVACANEDRPIQVEQLPAAAQKFIKAHFPDSKISYAKIIKIDRDRRDYEVSLSNRLELTFDMKFNLVEIDD